MNEEGYMEVLSNTLKGESFDSFTVSANKDAVEPAVTNCTWNGLVSYNICDSFKGISMLAVQYAFWCLRKDYMKDPKLVRFVSSFDNLCNFLIAIQLRLLVPLAMQARIGDHFNSLFETEISFCEFFAFVETFCSAYEVEWLTHLCIERYVIAKYVTNGWTDARRHNQLYMNLCLFFAALYASQPLLGIGNYGHEFTCASCTVDYILPDTWQRYAIMAFFFMRSAKPTLFMLTMLFRARLMECKMKTSMKKQTELLFTKMIMMITLVNLMCWAPLVFVKGKLLLNQFWFHRLQMPDPYRLRQALCVQEMSPFLTAVTILYYHYTRERSNDVREKNDMPRDKNIKKSN